MMDLYGFIIYPMNPYESTISPTDFPHAEADA
jgi:hypothetical protein